MNKIALKGMQFYAYHGFYEEENIMGGYYNLDVTVQVDFSKAGQNDNLADTINYENIYAICKEVMNTQAKLLEHLVMQIEYKLISFYPSIKSVNIVLSKLNPPLGGKVGASEVSIEKDYKKKCGRCDSTFLCHNNGACWCQEYTLSDSVTADLKRDFQGCLCQNCLSEYGS